MFGVFFAFLLSFVLPTLYCESSSTVDIPPDVSNFIKSYSNDWCKGGDSWRFYTDNGTIDWLGVQYGVQELHNIVNGLREINYACDEVFAVKKFTADGNTAVVTVLVTRVATIKDNSVDENDPYVKASVKQSQEVNGKVERYEVEYHLVKDSEGQWKISRLVALEKLPNSK